MPWARLMRGSRSKLKTVALLAARARRASSDWATPKKLSMATPCGQGGDLLGARRVDPHDQPRARRRSAAASGATVAPASV